jgi:hypothetical protein
MQWNNSTSGFFGKADYPPFLYGDELSLATLTADWQNGFESHSCRHCFKPFKFAGVQFRTVKLKLDGQAGERTGLWPPSANERGAFRRYGGYGYPLSPV